MLVNIFSSFTSREAAQAQSLTVIHFFLLARFGGICFLAIVTRTFEPLVQTLTQSSDEEKRSRERLSGGQLPSPRYIEQGKLPLTLAEPPRQYRGRRRGNTSSGRDSLARNSVNSYSELEDHEMVGVRGASTGSPQDREAVAGQRAHRGLGIDGPMEHLVDQDIPFASTPYVASPPEAATSGFLVEQTVEHSYEQNSLKALRRPLPTMRSGDLGYPPSSPISPASFGSPATPMTPATPYMPNSQAPLLSPTSPGWPVWDQAKYDRAASRHGATGTGTSFGERAVERFGLGIRRPRTTESFVEENTVELPLSPIEIPEQADRAERRPAWLPPAEWGSPDLAEELIIEERERARARQNSPNDSQTSFHTSTLELSSSLHHHGSSS